MNKERPRCIRVEHFHFNCGEEALAAYESSPGQRKHFCRHCGSPILSRNAMRPEQVCVRLGTLESDIEERPMAHISVTSKANREDICGDLPQYEAHEPGR